MMIWREDKKLNFCSLEIQISSVYSFWNWTSREKMNCSLSALFLPLPGNSYPNFILLESFRISSSSRDHSCSLSPSRCIEFWDLQRWLEPHGSITWCLPYYLQVVWNYKYIKSPVTSVNLRRAAFSVGTSSSLNFLKGHSVYVLPKRALKGHSERILSV